MSEENENVGAEELSLRDSLSDAFEASREGEGMASAPAAPAPEGQGAAPAAAPAQPRADGRDASGRFAPKPAEASQAAPVDAQPAVDGQQAAPETPRAPASWTAAAKSQFSTLTPEIQAEITRREREIEQGFAQQQARLEVANKFDALIAPFKDRFAAEGVDPIQATQRLYAAQAFLEKNPVEGLLYLARTYGVHPSRLAQAAGVQQPGAQVQAQLPPQLQGLVQEVNSLKSQLSQRTQAEQAQRQQAVTSEIQSFAADPANTYFHNVRDDMIALLSSGRAKDLKDAYDKAVWTNPETRQLIQADQSKKAEAERLNAQRASANGARRASGSVVGAPGPGTGPAGAGTSTRSLREEIAENIRAHRA